MRVASGFRRATLWLLLSLCLSGCSPFLDSDSEEKNPLVGDGLAKKAAYNYQGAVESFERALEGDPRLARPHWELGLLYSQNVPDPAAAIYHFQRLLKLRPDWRQADTARQFINAATIELAKSAPLGPQTPHMQQQLDKLTSQVHDMAGDNNRLRQQNQAFSLQVQQLSVENSQLRDKLRALQVPAPSAGRPAPTPVPTAPPATWLSSNVFAPAPAQNPATVSATPAPVGPHAVTSSGAAPTGGAPPPAPAPKPRTYTVQSGDRLSLIAAQHGLKLRDVVRANPGLNPDRLKVGQVIKLP